MDEIEMAMVRGLIDEAGEDGDCWGWRKRSRTGHNQKLYLKSRKVELSPQRLVHELITGEVAPKGLWMVRECGNLRCVNPSHMALLTKAEFEARRR